jgi:S1-C subfamily serine protease
VVRSVLGISVQDGMSAELAESFGVPGGKGVVITEVQPEGPGERAGLKPGDVVTTFDGEPVAESYRLRWLTGNTAPGKKVKLGIWRNGKPLQLAAVLEEKPGSAPEAPAPLPVVRREEQPFGFAVDEALSDARGVRVANVDLRGPAYRAGVREGDLIVELDGKPVANKAAWQKAVGQLGSKHVSRLYVRRGGRAIFFGVRRETQPVARAE